MPETCKFNPAGVVSLVDRLTPITAGPATELVGKNTIAAVGRIVLGQTSAKGTEDSYVRIRASAGGTILASATVIDGSTDLTHINPGSDAETFAIEIEAWLELVVTAATVSMLSSATINDIGADNVNNVFARFATPTSAAEATTQRAYVFETDDPSITGFYEATPQTVYGAGTASCDGDLTFYSIVNGKPAFVYAGSSDPNTDGISWDGPDWFIWRSGSQIYQNTDTADSPAQCTLAWTVGGSGTAPAPTVLGVTYDVEVASRVQLGHGIMAVGTAVVQTDVGTKQALLSAVPVGYKRIVTEVIPRNPSANISTYADSNLLGFDAGASNWHSAWDAAKLTTTNLAAFLRPQNLNNTPLGVAGEIFGVLFGVTTVPGFLTIDVWYYDVPA